MLALITPNSALSRRVIEIIIPGSCNPLWCEIVPRLQAKWYTIDSTRYNLFRRATGSCYGVRAVFREGWRFHHPKLFVVKMSLSISWLLYYTIRSLSLTLVRNNGRSPMVLAVRYPSRLPIGSRPVKNSGGAVIPSHLSRLLIDCLQLLCITFIVNISWECWCRAYIAEY